MVSITSWVGRYSGLVAYSDNTKKSFNVQSDGHNVWSANQTESFDTERDVKWNYVAGQGFRYYARENSLWRGLAMVGNTAVLDSVPKVSNKITDVVYSISMTFTLDDGKTYPVTATYDRKGGYYYQDLPDLVSSASNIAEYKTKIREMLLTIISYVAGL